jgi:hypothetical protein
MRAPLGRRSRRTRPRDGAAENALAYSSNRKQTRSMPIAYAAVEVFAAHQQPALGFRTAGLLSIKDDVPGRWPVESVKARLVSRESCCRAAHRASLELAFLTNFSGPCRAIASGRSRDRRGPASRHDVGFGGEFPGVTLDFCRTIFAMKSSTAADDVEQLQLVIAKTPGSRAVADVVALPLALSARTWSCRASCARMSSVGSSTSIATRRFRLRRGSATVDLSLTTMVSGSVSG